MRLIIAGSRTVIDRALVFETIERALLSWFPAELVATPSLIVDEVVSGRQYGVDRMGEAWARLHDIEVKTFEPDWEKHGKGAGPIRNALMAKYAAEDHGALIAIWSRRSAGTSSMINLALAADLLVHVREVE